MQPIRSPIEIGDVSRPRWYQAFYGRRWKAYFHSLKVQLKQRGPDLDSAWGTPERLAIAREIEAILAEYSWGETIRFHPNDPWRVISEWEIDELSEVEAIPTIETRFGVTLGDS